LARLREETKGEFGGIGVVLSATDTLPVVEEVIKDGPAAKAGIEAGDVLTTLDGEDVKGLPLEKLSSVIRGKPGTTLTLEATRGSKAEKLTFTVIREIIRVPDVKSEMLADGIGLVRVMAFDENAADDMRSALAELVKTGLKGLIIDVRGNPGGLVKQATEICDMFLNSGRIISLKGRDARPEPPVDATRGVVVPDTVPIVVLVDHGTASASEILSGALQANGRATVVGTGTVGKGAVTGILALPDGSGVVMTVAHYELAGGEVIQEKGIKPDVAVGELPSPPKGLEPAKAQEWYREQREKARKEQLDRAVAILKEKLAK
jgi:carboxyl-terminal processing protease